MSDLVDLVGGAPQADASLLLGVVCGVVTNNRDPADLGRVKLRFPWLSGADESAWARIAAPMAGPDAGTFFLPEVDDEVLVAFEHGDVRFPYVLGSLWHAGDPPAAPPADSSGGKRRMIRSRSGLTITLDDSDGAERIEIADGSSAARIVIDAAGTTIEIEAGSGITIKAADGPLALEAQSIAIKATTTLVLQAGSRLDIDGKTTSVKGSPITLG